MAERHTVQISFPDTTPDVAGRLANDLAKEIRRSVKEGGRPIEPTLTRTDPTAQDFGTTLVLVLGTPVVGYLGRALVEWVKRTNTVSIAINGVTIKNLESKDVANIIVALDSADHKRS
jgi:hypothetical protein